MYLIPYFFGKPLPFEKTETLQSLWIFMTDGGKQFWKTDPSDSKLTPAELAKEYLEENGLFGRLVCVKGDCLFYEVDRTKTNVQSFYTWPELFEEDEKEGWRAFFWLAKAATAAGAESEFKFGTSLNEISIPPLGALDIKTVNGLFEVIKTAEK